MLEIPVLKNDGILLSQELVCRLDTPFIATLGSGHSIRLFSLSEWEQFGALVQSKSFLTRLKTRPIFAHAAMCKPVVKKSGEIYCKLPRLLLDRVGSNPVVTEHDNYTEIRRGENSEK